MNVDLFTYVSTLNKARTNGNQHSKFITFKFILLDYLSKFLKSLLFVQILLLLWMMVFMIGTVAMVTMVIFPSWNVEQE